MPTLKKNARGVYTVTIKTQRGQRTVSTHCTERTKSVKVVKDSKLEEMELASKSKTLTSEVISLLVSGRKITVTQAVQDWLEWMKEVGISARTADNCMTVVNSFISGMKLHAVQPTAITAKDISEWINRKDGSKLGTKKGELSAVRSLFKFLAAKSLVVGNPAALVRINMAKLDHEQKEPRKKLPFTAEDIATLTTTLETDIHDMAAKEFKDDKAIANAIFWKCAILIGRHTGLRLGDICQLEWASIGKDSITVWTDKRDVRVELPNHPGLRRAISQIPMVSDKYCFPVQRATVLDPKRRALLSVQFGRLCARVGILGHTFHDLRHTNLSRLVNAGMTLEAVAKLAGHRSTATTEGYVHEIN